ncbi:helix-turn-helix domain-containing protein [Paenibacillus sp. OK076]|uniref:helix-turn-helix domain-containing protein n=1 Tax=Paenibacillus sp. OK076 TaxID=1884379 RepID=UPI0008CA49AE|nr:helix-turn-helix domain-containing protein [Paenibacillus sp. OK076]SEP34677.1 Helix-turn-helix domain-containing protein [Paenibacillus sp. OK076]
MSYSHLSIIERSKLEILHRQGKSARAIAEELGRHHTTICREISRKEIIPVVSGYGRINLLLGVTAEELEIAKIEDDIYVVADKMFGNGYINYSPHIIDL